MGLFGGNSDLGKLKSLAQEIRGRSSRGSFDGARVFDESKRLLDTYPTLSDLLSELKGRRYSRIERDYEEVVRFVSKMRRTETVHIQRKRTAT